MEAFHWIFGETPAGPIRCGVKIRYGQREQPATAIPLENGRVRLRFDDPQRAITPGQAAVLYDGDVVLGGDHSVILFQITSICPNYGTDVLLYWLRRE